ncbi:MAG: hypothetical protein ACHBN1_33535 [Heteroscytonema crispum UTEX LB 1556]
MPSVAMMGKVSQRCVRVTLAQATAKCEGERGKGESALRPGNTRAGDCEVRRGKGESISSISRLGSHCGGRVSPLVVSGVETKWNPTFTILSLCWVTLCYSQPTMYYDILRV